MYHWNYMFNETHGVCYTNVLLFVVIRTFFTSELIKITTLKYSM